MPLLTCRDLVLGYDGKIVAKDLSFEINAGDYLCIVGENGSGKSTLMKTILGLHSPMSGEITAFSGTFAKEIGYLPQQTELQRDFPASVREIVLSGCLNRTGLRPFYNSAEKKTAAANMERLEISPLANRCYRELSGGQQQRVLLARALCAAEKILLLDEPAAGLDPLVSAEMYNIIAKINREDRLTVIMISHDIAGALKYASHILHIGAPGFFGSVPDYIKSPASRFFGCGTEEGTGE